MTTVSKINDKFYINFTDPSTGGTHTIEVTELDPNNPKSLKLPKNPSNRQYLSIERIEKSPNQTYELTPKDPRKNGPIERTPKKPDRDYLSDEDKLIYDNLMNKIKEAKELEKAQKNRPLTEAEKLMRTIERLQSKLEKLNEKGDN